MQIKNCNPHYTCLSRVNDTMTHDIEQSVCTVEVKKNVSNFVPFRYVELPFPSETLFIYCWNSFRSVAFRLESLSYMCSREGRHSRDAKASL